MGRRPVNPNHLTTHRGRPFPPIVASPSRPSWPALPAPRGRPFRPTAMTPYRYLNFEKKRVPVSIPTHVGSGAYTAAAQVVAQAGSATYGPVSRPFQMVNLAYLPLVLRSD